MRGGVIPEIRFRNFSDEWEYRKLKDEGKTFSGLSGKTKNDFGHGDARFITYMNVFKNVISDKGEIEPVEIDENQNEVKFGDVFFTTSSETPDEVGMSSLWLYSYSNIYLNSFCFGFRLNDINKYDLNFLAYKFRSKSFRKSIIFLAQGISRYNISKNKVLQIKIAVPINKKEQIKIGAFLFKLEALLKLYKERYKKLEYIKETLLVKMFV